MKRHLEWIDFLKGLAIIAVILDHLFNVIYYSPEAHLFTIFSVTLFIFLSGVTSVISLSRNNKGLWEYQKRRLTGVLVPYIVATIIYSVVNQNYRFIWNVFWDNLVWFKASPPFYFILFFSQLIVVAPYLYRALSKMNVIFKLLSLVPIYFISKYLTHFTEVSGIYGGGGRILGGSYLFVFYLGMLSFMLYQSHSEKINRVWVHVIVVISSALMIIYIYNAGWLAIAWSNPPNKQAIFYTLAVLAFAYSVHMLLAKMKITHRFLSLFSIIGKYSLYIFLYHMLAIHYTTKLLNSADLYNNNVIKAIFLLTISVVVPTVIGIVTKSRSKVVSTTKRIFLKKQSAYFEQ